MSLDQVLNRLAGGKFSGTLQRYNQENIVGGRRQTSYAVAVDVDFFTMPDGTDDYKTKSDDGGQVTDNRHFYFSGIFNINQLDLLTYNDSVYEIRGPEQRPHGNFTYAYGKFIKRATDDV